MFTTPLDIANGSYSCTFLVVQDLPYDALLGSDFLRENGAIINLKESMLQLDGKRDEPYPEKELARGLTCDQSPVQLKRLEKFTEEHSATEKTPIKQRRASRKRALPPAFIGTLLFPSATQMCPTKVIAVPSRFPQLAIVERRMFLGYWSVNLFWPRFLSLYTYWLQHTQRCLTKTFTKFRWLHGYLPYQSELSTWERLPVYSFTCASQTQKSPIKLDKQMMNLRPRETRRSQSNREFENNFHLWRQVMPIFQQDQLMTFLEAVVH